MPIIKSLYQPRPYMREFHQRSKRFAMLVMHRRAGKTVGVVNDLLEKATYNTRPNPRYGYIAPLYRQAKEIAWTYLKDYAAPFNPKISESGLFIELPHNGARITLYGADNPDSFRGLYFDGAALDEFGNMRPSVWKEVLLPALIDRRGWAVFMGTPNGPNHFRDMWYEKKDDDSWFCRKLDVKQTGVIPEEDLAEMRKIMDEEEFAQEMMCSFEASTRGAYYARQAERAEMDGRVAHHPAQPGLPIHFVLDLGWRDDTAIWCWQEVPEGARVVRTMAGNTRPISHYIALINQTCKDFRCPRGKVWLPHDAKAKSLQTGLSMVEQFIKIGIKPSLVPQLDLLDGIAASRSLFEDYWFDEKETKDGFLALKSYHKEWDEDKKVFRDQPSHDWSSHYADSFRYMNLARSTYRHKKQRELVQQMDANGQLVIPASYGFALEDIWSLGPQRNRRL